MRHNNKSGKPKILLQYLSLIHYRKSLFTRLINDDSIDFKIVCGKDSPYPNMMNYNPEGSDSIKLLNNFYFSIANHRFIWQRKIFKHYLKESPDILILLGMDPHILSNIFLFFFALSRGTKILWWGHATFGRTKSKLLHTLRKYFYVKSDGILVYDQNGHERMINIGIDPKKISVLWNCINDEDLSLNKKGKSDDFLCRLVFSGRIEKRKNLDIVLQAVELQKRKENPIYLNIIGEGPYLPELVKLVSNFNIQNYVCFHGEKYGRDALNIITGSDIGIVPNAAGLSLIHYMGNGLPVLCSDKKTSHGPEIAILIDEKTGLYFRENDVISLIQKIELINQKFEEYSTNCIDIIKKKYNSEKVYLNLKKALEKILDFKNETNTSII